MYLKNKQYLKQVLNDYKEEKIELSEAIQGIQNIIGEEVERKDRKTGLYEIDEEEIKTNV